MGFFNKKKKEEINPIISFIENHSDCELVITYKFSKLQFTVFKDNLSYTRSEIDIKDVSGVYGFSVLKGVIQDLDYYINGRKKENK